VVDKCVLRGLPSEEILIALLKSVWTTVSTEEWTCVGHVFLRSFYI
jgi:hypothetical protein